MGDLNISITGDLGSGKSSVAKALCQKLGFKYLSTGLMQREIAQERGMDTLQLNYYAENNIEIDQIIDERIRNISNVEGNFILDSRLAWFFVNKSFKLYLTVHPEIAAKRVLKDQSRTGEPNSQDLPVIAANLLERRAVENRRFKKIYGVDCADLNNYNLVVDTSSNTVEDIANLILEFYNLWKNGLHFSKFWASPASLYALEGIRQLARENAKDIFREINDVGFNALYPIEIIKWQYFMFILDGHKRTSGSLLSHIKFIPFSEISNEEFEAQGRGTVEQLIEAAYSPSQTYDWEEMHQFRYEVYPALKEKTGHSGRY